MFQKNFSKSYFKFEQIRGKFPKFKKVFIFVSDNELLLCYFFFFWPFGRLLYYILLLLLGLGHEMRVKRERELERQRSGERISVAMGSEMSVNIVFFQISFHIELDSIFLLRVKKTK